MEIIDLLAGRRARRLLQDGRRRLDDLDLDGAEPLLRDAMAAARESAGNAVLDVGEGLYEVLARRRKLDEAVPILEELVAGHLRRRGPDALVTVTWRNELVRVLCQLGRYAEAEAVGRERLDSARRQRPPDRRAEGNALATLAWCLRGQRRWEEAEEMAREALAVLGSPGVRRGAAGWARAGLAAGLLRQMELEQASALLRQAGEEWSSIGRADLSAAAEEQLMDVYVVAERHGDALALSEASINRPRRGAAALADRERQLRTLDRHAYLLHVEGRSAEAYRFERRAEYLRDALTAESRGTEGAGIDPSGPVFEDEPLPDWALPGVAVRARAC